MTDPLERGRPVSNMWFAYDLDGFACSEDEVAELIRKLNENCSANGIKISAEKK